MKPIALHELACVIVTYHPQANEIQRLVTVFQRLDVPAYFIDNSVSTDTPLPNDERTVRLASNLGIAAAQNHGVQLCQAAGYRAIIFFDQDSLVTEALVLRLLATLNKENVSICAPVIYDHRQGQPYPVINITPRGTRVRLAPQEQSQPLKVSFAIASGMMVRTEVFDRVGLMDEALFIDYVDTEWCLRCASFGIPIAIDPGARLDHYLGDATIRFAGITIAVHSPERRYYRVRNALLLWRRAWVPKKMLLRDLLHSIVDQIIMMGHRPALRWRYAALYLKAWRDGLCGVGGKLSETPKKP